MGFDLIERFWAYADAFEEAYDSDDWTLVGAFYSADATSVLEGVPAAVRGPFVGRPAVLQHFKDGCDRFDRRFPLREPRLAGELIRIPGGVAFSYVVTYSAEGIPSYELRGEEINLYRDGLIKSHRERLFNFDEGLEHVSRYRDNLRPPR